MIVCITKYCKQGIEKDRNMAKINFVVKKKAWNTHSNV